MFSSVDESASSSALIWLYRENLVLVQISRVYFHFFHPFGSIDETSYEFCLFFFTDFLRFARFPFALHNRAYFNSHIRFHIFRRFFFLFLILCFLIGFRYHLVNFKLSIVFESLYFFKLPLSRHWFCHFWKLGELSTFLLRFISWWLLFSFCTY